MAINPTGAVGDPLNVLGGWVTEMAATALPEGVSPDCQDVAFLPGSVFSRPCLKKVFAAPFPSGGPNGLVPTAVYGKTFVTSTGITKNLYLDSNGVLWVEDFTNSPGTYTQLVQTTPGSFCKSITAFGREWLAFSDGLHGTDIAYQYDGTNLARVTQDGPGAPPTVVSIPLASSTLNGGGGGGTGVVSFVSLSTGGSGYYGGAFVAFTGGGGGGASATATVIGGVVVGLTLRNGGTGYTSDPTLTIFGGGTGATGTAVISGGGGGGGNISLSRANNTVTATTTAAHGLQIGYQAQISGVASSTVGTVTSIVINNEDLPGEATVTTAAAHGLAPGEFVTITGVLPSTVGGSISSAARAGDIVTLTTASAHALVPGAVITVAGVTDTTFDGSFTVQLVPSPTTIIYAQVDVDATSSAGTVKVAWPIPGDTLSPTYFEVLSAPTSTTFAVQVTYQNGTWTTGSITYRWNGIFYVTAVPSATQFQYQQYGPNSTTTVTGTVTPYGQCSPGLHLCQQLFLLKDGTITEPSPPTTFLANGGQYVSVTNMAIGPANVVARILAFTGAQPNVPGTLPPFFYLAVPAQLEGQFVSTATQINDNLTTSALLDFSDNSLFATAATGGALSVTGNNAAQQIVIDGALGFAYFDSRLTTFGQRNRIQNLLSMGFGGGNLSGSGVPLGWAIPPGSVGGTYTPGNWGGAWAVSASAAHTIGTSGLIQQGTYADAYGVPIVDPNTFYKVRFQVLGVIGTVSQLTFVFFLSSASAAFTATATVTAASLNTWQANNFAWLEATFNAAMPETIPPDMVFGFYAISGAGIITFRTTEWSLIDAEQPYLDNQAFTSYTNNPTGFDGVTGNGEPTEDTHKIMDFSVLRGTPYAHTQDPSGRLHEILVNPTSEPVGWGWKEVSANCGTLSAFGLTKSQADDNTASGGDDWLAWPSEDGATIFDGSEPKKISQEIQPSWNDPTSTAWPQINMGAARSIWALNDPVTRTMYFGLPLGAAIAPNIIYPVSYRELNSAYAITNSPPFHPSLSGKLVATDNTRKWTRWNLAINGAARMCRSNGSLTTVFFGGNGSAPGAIAGFGNVYTLDPAKLTDDNYGQVRPYYVTHFFLDPDKAQALQLTSVRLMLAYLTAFISGTGTVTYSYLCDALANAWALTTSRTLSATPRFDQEIGGGMAQGNRIAIKIASTPAQGQTDNGFNLQRFQAFWKKARLQIRGAAQ